MKKSILILSIVVSSITAFGQKQVIGHVETQQIMQSLYAKDSIQFKLEKKQRALQTELQRQQNELIMEKRRLGAALDTLDQAVAKMRSESLAQREAELQNVTVPNMRRQLQMVEQNLLAPIEKKITDAIAKVAKAEGLTYVIEAGTLLFTAENAKDITVLVRKELGLPEKPEEITPAAEMPMGY